jgi:V/A-type H+-transporting ATPase subunit K
MDFDVTRQPVISVPAKSHRMLFAVLAMMIGVTAISLMAAIAYSQQVPQQAQGVPEKGLYLLGAGIAAGLAALGAGVGLGTASAAAIGAIAEKPELLGRTLLYIVLIEAIAIYGLAMFFIIFSLL